MYDIVKINKYFNQFNCNIYIILRVIIIYAIIELHTY